MMVLSAIRNSGIVARLSASFVAVALLAIAANFWADHAANLRITRVERLYAPSPASPAVVETRPAEALPLGPARDYLRALELAYQAALNRTVANSPESSALRKARDQLAHAARNFAAQLPPAAAPLAGHFMQQSDAMNTSIEGLADLADRRQFAFSEYRRHLIGMDESLKSALDSSFKIFGRFIARQYLLQLSGNLEVIRKRFDENVSRDEDVASLTALAAAEHGLASMLNENAASLQKVQGQAWLDAMRAEVVSLAQNRETLQRLRQEYATAHARLVQRKLDLTIEVTDGLGAMHLSLAGSVAHPQIVQNASDALAPLPSREEVTLLPRDTSRDHALAWITSAVIICVFLISLFTVLSIIRPVRRLLRAASMLARGNLQARVTAGGLKELDELGQSFNEMADRLARAHDASQSYQFRLEADVAAQTRELRDMAERDPLTSLPNRRVWQQLTQECLQDALAEAREVGVFFIDLDNFKNINDSLGHSFGDGVLLAIAQRLDEISCGFGFAARVGGDEFCVVCARAQSQSEIEQAGDALVRAFRAPILIDQRELTVTVSIGLSLYPAHGTTPAELLSAADAALFRAKALGRNQISRFTPDLRQSANERFNLEQRLRRAIQRDELELVFQPEIEVASSKVGLVEALIRWRQPDGRLASPAEFLEVAETSGIIADIDEWVLQAAVRTASEWHHGAWPEAKIAVNVSSRQLSNPDFANRLLKLLVQHRLPEKCIEIELTENALQTGPAVLQTLHKLQEHTIAVALDDFGTGYSSLTSIEQLPLYRVKLDRSLICGVGTEERSTAIVQALIALCEHLNLRVTAEGIETAAQLSWLLNYKQLCLQGFLLSRPLAAADLLPAIIGMPEQLVLRVLTQRAATHRRVQVDSSGGLAKAEGLFSP